MEEIFPCSVSMNNFVLRTIKKWRHYCSAYRILKESQQSTYTFHLLTTFCTSLDQLEFQPFSFQVLSILPCDLKRLKHTTVPMLKLTFREVADQENQNESNH